MEKEFTPYELALALKELGFDEPCLAQYKKYDVGHATLDIGFSKNEIIMQFHKLSKFCSAPLYQQAFAFFRDTYNLDGSMSVDVWNKKTTSYRITGGIKGIVEANSYGALYDIDSKDYDTYEEAQIECLKQLIEIIKEKK